MQNGYFAFLISGFRSLHVSQWTDECAAAAALFCTAYF